ncbi:condensation domain-containing protein [Bacillus sonorensis]|nr:condensation domain-containing protein [Bacillus sonorensis]
MQQVLKTVPFTVSRVHGTEQEADHWAQSFVQPFALSKAPLLRAGMMEIGADRHLLAIDMHHIIADGVTLSIFINEFSKLYDAADLPPLKIQYKDFAVWQHVRMKNEAYRKKKHTGWSSYPGNCRCCNCLPINRVLRSKALRAMR